MGTSHVVSYFIETRTPSGGVQRDAWIAKWGRPTREALLRVTRPTLPAGYSVRVVRQSGEIVVGWVTP